MIFDKNQAIRFLQSLYQSENPRVIFRTIKDKTAGPALCVAMSDSLGAIESRSQSGQNIYFMPNRSGNGDTTDASIVDSYACFIDLDGVSAPSFFALPPSALIEREDGRGAHCYWFFAAPVDMQIHAEAWSAAQKALIHFYKSDPVIHNPARLMRLPGTLNFKAKAITENGGEPPRYSMTACDQLTRYSIEDIISAHTDGEKLKTAVRHKLRALFSTAPIREGERHAYMIRAGFLLNDYAIPIESRREILLKINRTKCEPPQEESEIEQYVNCEKYAKSPQGAGAVDLAIQKEKKIELVRKAFEDWYYVSDIDSMVSLRRPSQYYNLHTVNCMYADVIAENNITMFALKHSAINHAASMVYEPGLEPVIDLPHGKGINMWTPSDLVPTYEDASWFVDHIKYLLPYPEDHNYLLDFMAHAVQFPRKKIRHVVVLIGEPGIGKSIMSIALKKIFGPSNVAEPSNESLDERFTGWAKHCQLVLVNELYQNDRAAFANKVKAVITDDTTEVREMYRPPYTINNYINILAFTNIDDPVLIAKEDRRWCFLRASAIPRDPAYYVNLAKTLHEKASDVMGFFLSRDVSHFQPGAAPPMNKAKQHVVDQSRAEAEMFIEDLMTEHIGPFEREIVNLEEVLEYIRAARNDRQVTVKKIGKYLRSMGASYLEKPVKAKSDGGRRHFWAVRNHEKWIMLDNTEDLQNAVRDEYMKVLETEEEQMTGLAM